MPTAPASRSSWESTVYPLQLATGTACQLCVLFVLVWNASLTPPAGVGLDYVRETLPGFVPEMTGDQPPPIEEKRRKDQEKQHWQRERKPL